MSNKVFTSKYPFKKITRYISRHYTNLQDWQVENQKSIRRFQNGTLSEKEMENLANLIIKIINKSKSTREWVITYIPASTNKKYEKRYFTLTGYLRKHIDVPVAYFGICIKEECDEYSRHGKKAVVDGNLYIKPHLLKVKNRNVILIDDNITTGRTLRTVGDFLIDKGAWSVIGVIYSMTIHPRLPYNKKYKRIW